ncbi:MAG: response regulator, partial [Desulfobacterales bacterium]
YIPKEEMVNIASFLEDIMDARNKGQNTWSRWFDRLGSYCERRFGPDWQRGDRIFWEKFPFH